MSRRVCMHVTILIALHNARVLISSSVTQGTYMILCKSFSFEDVFVLISLLMYAEIRLKRKGRSEFGSHDLRLWLRAKLIILRTATVGGNMDRRLSKIVPFQGMQLQASVISNNEWLWLSHFFYFFIIIELWLSHWMTFSFYFFFPVG